MTENLKRVQMLIREEQGAALAEIARAEGCSVAEVTRRALDLGLKELKVEDEFTRRARAMKKAEELRAAMRQRRGKPLNIDIVEDLRQMREERIEQLTRFLDR